jgi:acyl carrier protein
MTMQGIKSMDTLHTPKNGSSRLDHVLKVIYESVSDLNLQLARELDSLGLANFIVITEQKLDDSFGFPIDLTENDPFSPATGHFRTIHSLATYISELISSRPEGAVR